MKEEWINGYFLVDMDSIVVGLECFPHGQPYVSAYVAGTDALQEDLKEMRLKLFFVQVFVVRFKVSMLLLGRTIYIHKVRIVPVFWPIWL